MKKLVLLFVFVFAFNSIFLVLNASAQITLGTNDLPKSGKIYNLSLATKFTGMDATLTGANYNWDYSLLSTTRTVGRIDTFLSIAQTAQLYALYFAFGSHLSNQAIAGNNFALGTFITVSNAFNFFNNTSASYNQTGFGGNISVMSATAIPTPIGYSPQDVIYKFPLNYGNIDSSNSAYNISLAIIYYGVNMKRHNEVDGWGKLTLPMGTFDALRIKSTIVEVDTFHIDTLLHYGMTLPPTTRVEYKWLGAGRGEPLLQINMTGTTVTQIVYEDSLTTGILAANEPSLNLNVYPNPASKEIFLQYSLATASNVVVDITDIAGNVVLSSDQKNQESGVHFTRLDLPSTLISTADYFVRLSANGTQTVKPLIIAK